MSPIGISVPLRRETTVK